MAARLFEYHAAIIRASVDEGREKGPSIFSLVVYHGKLEWRGPRSIAELFLDFESYVFCMKSPFLVDLPRVDLAEFKQHEKAALVEMLLALQPSGDFCSKMEEIAPTIMGAKECCKNEALSYISSIDKHQDKEVLEEFTTFAPEEGTKQLKLFQRAIRENTLKVRRETAEKIRKETTERVRSEDRKKLLATLQAQGLNEKQIQAILTSYTALN